jgi:hypothetical protein
MLYEYFETPGEVGSQTTDPRKRWIGLVSLPTVRNILLASRTTYEEGMEVMRRSNVLIKLALRMSEV